MEQEQGALSSAVVGFGGSYGGMLAAWFRMRYPHLIVGAIAASAPIWQDPQPQQPLATITPFHLHT